MQLLDLHIFKDLVPPTISLVVLNFDVNYSILTSFIIANHPDYPSYAHLLSFGWLPGRSLVDVADHQWRKFRNGLPLAIAFFVLFLFVSRGISWMTRRKVLEEKLKWKAFLSLGSLFLLHGFNIFKIILILVLNYEIAKRFHFKNGRVIATWVFSLGILLFLEYFKADDSKIPLVAFLDRWIFGWWEGFVPRWHVTFNLTVLRCISFNLDYHWMKISPQYQTTTLQTLNCQVYQEGLGDDHKEQTNQYHATLNNQYHANLNSQYHEALNKQCHEASSIQQQRSNSLNNKEAFLHGNKCQGNDCERHECRQLRIKTPPTANLYNLSAYLAYCTYPPLYLAGPIITFNDFIHQMDRPLGRKTSRILWYGVRWLGAMLLMEVISHYFYVVAVKEAQAWNYFGPTDFAILAYLNLKLVWLKLLLIWRFFRLVAWVDGIHTVENMRRCMSNMYSGLAFWRAWHFSFNQWIIRYLYIPLGGRKTLIWNVWLVFGFVAIWHDLRLRLFLWSWLICLFLIPELALRWAANHWNWEDRFGNRQIDQWSWYSQAKAAAAGANIFLMGAANLVGFVMGGGEALRILLAAFQGWRGVIFGVGLATTLCAVGHVQLQIRTTERLLGINKKY